MANEDLLHSLNDSELVERLHTEHAAEAFAELWSRHSRQIHRDCRRVLGNDETARDIAQDTAVRALGHLNGFAPRNFQAWLRRIAHHLCINHLQSAVVRRELTGMQTVLEPRAMSQGGWRRELVSKLLAYIDTLPEPERVVLKLFYVEGCSYQEIQDRTGFAAQEVKNHIQTGRRKLRQKWETWNDAGK